MQWSWKYKRHESAIGQDPSSVWLKRAWRTSETWRHSEESNLRNIILFSTYTPGSGWTELMNKPHSYSEMMGAAMFIYSIRGWKSVYRIHMVQYIYSVCKDSVSPEQGSASYTEKHHLYSILIQLTPSNGWPAMPTLCKATLTLKRRNCGLSNSTHCDCTMEMGCLG